MSCPDCETGKLLPSEPTGVMNPDGSYLAPQPEGGLENRVIVLLSDAFGLPLKNSKILADNLSYRLSCDVWVPDLFDGKPPLKVGQLKLPDRAGVKQSTFDWIKFVFAVLPSLPSFIMNRPKVVDAHIASFILKLKSERSYTKVGAVGYCFGGAAAVRLGSTDLIDCIVICHPGRFNLTLVNSIRVPSSWACAEDDESFSMTLRKEAEAILFTMKKNGNASEYEFIDYKGTAHGFAARPNLAIPEVKQGYEKSFEQTSKTDLTHVKNLLKINHQVDIEEIDDGNALKTSYAQSPSSDDSANSVLVFDRKDSNDNEPSDIFIQGDILDDSDTDNE